MAKASPKPIPPEPLLSNSFVNLKKCKHGYFLYNQNDSYIGRSLDLYGEWTESELDILGQVIQPGFSILDIGAYIGTHTVFFAQKTGPQGNVIAIEPQRLPYYFLCSNISLNALTNVSCLNLVVGETPGQKLVPLIDPTIEFNFGNLRLDSIDFGAPMTMVTVDQLNLTKCDLIKIDVEQMETKVLSGAKNTIQRFRPILFVEVNDINFSTPILKLLQDYDYTLYWHISTYYNPENFFKNETNVFETIQPEANVLCIPKEKPSKITGLEPVIDDQDNWLKAAQRMQATYDQSLTQPTPNKSAT